MRMQKRRHMGLRGQWKICGKRSGAGWLGGAHKTIDRSKKRKKRTIKDFAHTGDVSQISEGRAADRKKAIRPKRRATG